MTLSGNLGFVPLDEVLRLLTRSGNTGVVEITNGNTRGRIFVAGLGVGLATTFDDHSLSSHLVSSGFLSEDAGPDSVAFNDDLLDLVREMTVESIYQMNREEADFEVVRDVSSPYSAPEPFDLEKILDDSRRRAEEWERVSKKLPDLGAVMHINRGLERETVELNRDSWRLVSEIGSGASVRDLAARLGTTEYAVANVAAAMVGDDLLEVEGYSDTEEAPAAESEPHEVPVEGAAAEEPEFDPNKSWWDEPEDETDVSADAEDADEPVSIEDDSEQPVSLDDDAAAADEDTDAFLEKVFSEVGGEPAEEDGHGLMRRRRMGSILRELGEE